MSALGPRRTGAVSSLPVAFGILLLASTAPAAVITVSGDCEFFAALENANDTVTGQPNVACAAGDPTGPDTVSLTADVVFTQTSNPPILTTEILVEGNGFAIVRSAGLSGRIFTINSTGIVAISDDGLVYTFTLKPGAIST